ncbi:helix-turn-helix domain-containing protein [Bradyrhizobium sp. 31Argb]|uniref:helix-turn-helix domain-containing protein n=1 Tax=Bradyrhizobium sp. 31Argb TaxID=3141247 RepID=UPI003747B0AA
MKFELDSRGRRNARLTQAIATHPGTGKRRGRKSESQKQETPPRSQRDRALKKIRAWGTTPKLATNIAMMEHRDMKTSSNPSPAGQASNAWQTFKDRDDWIRLFLAADGEVLSCTAKIVGTRLALHHNIETGRCDPSLTELASGTGMSDRNVRRMLRELEQTGWARVQSRGYHRSNSFELCVPEKELDRTGLSGQTDLRPDTDVRPDDPRPDKPGHMTGQTGYVRPDTVVRQKRESNSEEKSVERESLDLGDEDSGQRRSETHDDIESSFEEFYRKYPRKVSKGAALKAYRGVVTKKLATRAELLAGAMRYAAERSGQDPKFTKHPGTWLHGQCWQDEPAAPITSTIDADGRPMASPPPSRLPPQWRRESNTERLMRKLQGGA